MKRSYTGYSVERFCQIGKRALLGLVFFPSLAAAGPNDIRLSGLAQGFTPAVNAGDPRPLGQDRVFQARFAALSYQLGVLMAPTLLTPAETLGFDGFVVQTETSFTGIDTETGGAENYWVLGTEESNPSSTVSSLAIRVRKGLPYSFELGGGLSTILGSRLSTVQTDVKWSLLEGFQQVYFLPDIALRVGVSRLLGSPDYDLTTASAGAMISKPIGIQGNLSVTPFLSYEQLFVIALSQVVDFTPNVSAVNNPADSANNDVFAETDMRGTRLSGGFRVVYTKAVFTASFSSTPENDVPIFEAWNSAEDVRNAGTSDTTKVSELLGAPVKGQKTFQLAVGMDF